MEVEAIRKILQEHKDVLADVIASLLEENPAIIVKAIKKRPDIFSNILQPIKKDLDNLSGKIDDLSQKMATKDDLSLVIQTTKDEIKMVMEIIKAYQESTDKRFEDIIRAIYSYQESTDKRFQETREETNMRFQEMREQSDKRFQELIYFTEKRFEEMNKRFDFMFRVSLAFNIPLLISIIAMLLKIFEFI